MLANDRDEVNVLIGESDRVSPIAKTNCKTDSLTVAIGVQTAWKIAKIVKGIVGIAKTIVKEIARTARIIVKGTAMIVNRTETIDYKTAKIVGTIGMMTGTTITAIGITAAGTVPGNRVTVGTIGGITIPH